MKTLLKTIIIGMLVYSASPIMAATINSTLTTKSASPALLVTEDESADWSVVGLATGTIKLEESRDLHSWKVIATSVTTGSINWSGTVNPERRDTYYRFYVSTITTNSYITTIVDNDDLLYTIKNKKGKPVFQVYDGNRITTCHNHIITR